VGEVEAEELTLPLEDVEEDDDALEPDVVDVFDSACCTVWMTEFRLPVV
jgi:hypothetical protein